MPTPIKASVRCLLVAGLLAAVLVPTPAKAERVVTITGGGWGHGIGMSQYGAYGRAKNGKSAKRILTKYYSGANISTQAMPKRIRVGLLPLYGGSGLSKISFTSSPMGDGAGTLRVKVKGTPGKIAEGVEGDAWRAEASPTGGMRLYKNGEQVKVDGTGVFGGPNQPLVLKYQKFGTLVSLTGKSPKYAYGSIQLGTYSSDSCGGYCARAVLALSMQKYLYGLGEVPSSWPKAVLKAQAMAGRTYAYSKVKRSGQNRHPCDCAVYDSTIDQAYIGDSKRTGSGSYWAAWKSAVDDTLDKVILHQGEPIQALYSSSSGGHTEDNDKVWGGAAIPYLRGVRDGPDRAGGANPNFKWKVEMLWGEFSNKLDAAFGTGSVQDFQLVKPFGVSGRVTVVNADNTGGVRIAGSTKTHRASGWNVRQALGLKDSLFRVDVGQAVGSRFVSKYRSLDGAPGDVTSSVYRVPKGVSDPTGWAQDFSRGRMTDTSQKVVWQYGRVLAKYNRTGREKGKLGMPRSDVWGPGSHLGALYEKGRILRRKGLGAYAIRGVFESAFVAHGGNKGVLGLPRSDRHKRASLPNGGMRQRFTGGALYRVPEGDVYALWGRVGTRYIELGEAMSDCGYPVADQTEEAGKISADFKKGSITWTEGAGIKVSCTG
ncbi:MAG: SpoIID/LytB domain-containing protein [Actinomycetota bacterium]